MRSIHYYGGLIGQVKTSGTDSGIYNTTAVYDSKVNNAAVREAAVIFFAADAGNASDYEATTTWHTEIIDLPNQGAVDTNFYLIYETGGHTTTGDTLSVTFTTSNTNADPSGGFVSAEGYTYSRTTNGANSTLSLTSVPSDSLLLYFASCEKNTESFTVPSGWDQVFANTANTGTSTTTICLKRFGSGSESISNPFASGDVYMALVELTGSDTGVSVLSTAFTANQGSSQTVTSHTILS
jgi:hypothetical protein